MKLTVKTADKNPTELQVDASPTQTVEELGAQISEALGRKIKKVVCVGKIADWGACLADVGLADGGIVIVMAEKVSKKAAASPAASIPAPAPPAPSSASVAASAASASSHDQREPAAAAGGSDAAAIAQLTALGIADSERTAAQAVEMAAGDIDRAAELLVSGALAETAAAATTAAAAPDEELAELAAHPVLRQMRAHVASDPQLLRPLLQQLGQTNPDLLEQIAESPAAFVRQLTTPVEPADRQRFAPHGGVPRVDPVVASQRVSLSAKDEEALTTLSQMGSFSREQLVEAYLACGRNIEQAGTYLFDQL